MTSHKAAIAAIFCLALSTTAAPAATVDITNLTASWININPNSITAVGNGTTLASMRWGTPIGAGGQSGYDFQTAAVPISNVLPPSPTSPFSLGTFTHINQPVTGTSLTSATLQLDADIDVDSVSTGTHTFLLDFTHDETDNGADPCANGLPNGVGVNVNGCADLIDIVFNVLSDSFLVGSDLYTLTVSATSSSLQTVEEQSNRFDLRGVLTLRSAVDVPEPGTLALLALATLMPLGARLRRRA